MKSDIKGFTLIGVLVAISIIGVLATEVLSSLSSARERARDTRRLTEAKSLQKALELYYLDNNEYPQGYPSGTSNCSDYPAHNTNWNNLMLELADYMPVIPIDKPWPICTYYVSGGYSGCNGVVNPEYAIFFATSESTFSGLDLYVTQGENGSKARYCLYPN